MDSSQNAELARTNSRGVDPNKGESGNCGVPIDGF